MSLHRSRVHVGRSLTGTGQQPGLVARCLGHSLTLDGFRPALISLSELSVLSLPLPPAQATLAKSIAPSIASKQPGSETFLSTLVAEASLAVMPRNVADFNVDSVRVVKILGGALNHSRVVRGMVFGREPDGVVKKGSKMKVAVFTCGLDISQTETKGTVLLKNAGEMMDFTKGEEKQMENVRCLAVIDCGSSSADRPPSNPSPSRSNRSSKRLPTRASSSSSPARASATLRCTTLTGRASPSSRCCPSSTSAGCAVSAARRLSPVLVRRRLRRPASSTSSRRSRSVVTG